MTKSVSTFSIIGERYLDTVHDVKYLQSLDDELESRGVTGIKRIIYEYIAASSLWWNIVRWEWSNLGASDIIVGWIANIIAFGSVAVVLGHRTEFQVGIFVFIFLHLLTTFIGIKVRSGTKSTN